jgi:hypothetical protein
MRDFRLHAVVACAATLLVSGCGKEQSAPAAMAKVVEEKVPPYTYPAPVKGHLKQIDGDEFDLVDGIAYPAPAGGGTVVYVVSKPIASPMLVASVCPLTQVRALSKLRNASFSEVTLDAAGRSKYFGAGSALGGSLTDLTPRDWSSALKVDAGRAAGSVVHARYGRFDFDLPLLSPKIDQISYGDRQQDRRLAATTPKPTEQALTAAYVALHEAAAKKNLKAMLSALGFDAKQIAAIRGMDGIDADFMAFTDRFLSPGAPGEPSNRSGSGHVRAEGVKANGKKFTNDYYFDLCDDHLVLTAIVEQTP